MKKEKVIGVRIPLAMQSALERERKHMTRAAGAEVKTSAAIRALLEWAINERRAKRVAA